VFEAFQRNFTADPERAPGRASAHPSSSIPGIDELIARFGGLSFNRGLYRIVRASDLDRWQARVSLAFPHIGPRVTCFSYDWLGRAFAADPQRMEQGRAGIVMFEPGTGDVYEVPCNVETFHDQELISDGDGALATGAHREWLARGGAAPAFTQCIGYKVPLFLGGADDLDNFEQSDLEVYWDLMGQLIAKTNDSPPSAEIRGVTID
jgi:hypothetical protein